MAKFPYVVSGTTAVNGDQSITLVWTLKTASGATVHSDSVAFPSGTPPFMIFRTLFGSAKNYILKDTAGVDLPATFSFNISPTDLI